MIAIKKEKWQYLLLINFKKYNLKRRQYNPYCGEKLMFIFIIKVQITLQKYGHKSNGFKHT